MGKGRLMARRSAIPMQSFDAAPREGAGGRTHGVGARISLRICPGRQRNPRNRAERWSARSVVRARQFEAMGPQPRGTAAR